MATADPPSGVRSLTPYLLTEDVDRLLQFYATAFGAQTVERVETPGRGVHSALSIGDSSLMLGGPVPGRKAMLHYYVDELEDTVSRAVDAGATLTYTIKQAHYGERFGVVDDPSGNAWILAERATSTLRHPDMGTVTPYLNAAGAARLIAFLEQALGAEVVQRFDAEPRGVVHGKVRLHGSILELGDPEDGTSAFPMMFYLYVPQVEDAYVRALAAGATSLQEPARQDYGDYRAGFTDPVGNQWYVAEHPPETP